MGLPVDLCVSDSSFFKEFICPICTDISDDPVTPSHCDHLFCRQCLTSAFDASEGMVCPVCNVESRGPFKPINRIAKNFWLKLQFSCRFKSEGCENIIDLENFSRHISECEFQNCAECGRSFCHVCIDQLKLALLEKDSKISNIEMALLEKDTKISNMEKEFQENKMKLQQLKLTHSVIIIDKVYEFGNWKFKYNRLCFYLWSEYIKISIGNWIEFIIKFDKEEISILENKNTGLFQVSRVVTECIEYKPRCDLEGMIRFENLDISQDISIGGYVICHFSIEKDDKSIKLSSKSTNQILRLYQLDGSELSFTNIDGHPEFVDAAEKLE